MLGTLGYMPNLTDCVYCGTKVPDEMNRHFSSQRGGVLCPACTRPLPHRTYSEGTIPNLASVGNNRHSHRAGADSGEHLSEAGRPSDPARFEREARQIMENFISFHLDVEFKSYRILKTLL